MRMTKTIFVILAIAVSLVAAQNLLAATTVTVAGTVAEISNKPNKLVIDDSGVLTEVNGIRFNYLENRYNIVIEEGTYVSVEAYEYVCPKGITKLIAYSITVNDVTVKLRPAP